MHVENGRLILGCKNCTSCNEGTVPAEVACPACKGTGNGKRGGERGCKKCHGFGRVYDHEHPVVCTKCNGNYIGAEAETYCDYLPKEIWDAFEFVVYRTGKSMSVAESMIGLGCVFSCTDYGRAWDSKDDSILAKDVGETKHHQATKVVRHDGTLADHIGIYVDRGGYSVKPVFAKKKVELAIA